MLTTYWIAIAVFWIVGLIVWNKIYPKQKKGESDVRGR